MVREDDILYMLHNNPWFKPSKNGETKTLTDAAGNPILDENGIQVEAALSYYHICNNGNQITIRVSNHGTALQTWVKHQPDPALLLQNLSVVFSNGPVSSQRKTEAVDVLDSEGNKVKQHKYFVVEQYVYRIDKQTPKSIEKVIKSLEQLDPSTSQKYVPTEFKDPLRKQKSKKANVQILTPQDEDGNEVPSSNNPINSRQSDVVKKKQNEEIVRITESDLKRMVMETIRRLLN